MPQLKYGVCPVDFLTTEERDALMEELGMPKTPDMVIAQLHQHFMGGMGRFRGQEITGARPISVGIFGIVRAGLPPPAEISLTIDPDGDSPVWMQIWRFAAWKEKSSIVAELRCPPGRETSVTLRGLEMPHDPKDLQDVLQTIRLYALTLPPGAGRPARDETQAIQCAIWHDDEGSTHKEIAERLGWHLSLDEHLTPRRSSRVKAHIDLGRKLRGQKKLEQ